MTQLRPEAVASDRRDEAGNVTPLDDGVWLIDLGFRGRRGVVAAYLVAGGDEVALIETGPTTTLPALLAGIEVAGFAPEQVTDLLLTHIHLDHAGAAGPFVRRFPRATVRVHPVGAPHLIDPGKLLASATRIYGERMEQLWGEVAPIPAERVGPLADGETLTVAGRPVTALFTPGHASHHVCYWDAGSGMVFTGDVGGVRMPGTGYVCPPTPPPDLDLDAWRESVVRLRALGARRLCPTHFGVFDDVAAHLDQLGPNLEAFRDLARDALLAGADHAALTAILHDRMAAELGDVPAAVLENLEWATPSYMAALGLTRYLVKRGEVPKA
jgi:glyoxylase-like metal-dependent hydrolase (beta-lactamase superfamily II)